MRKLNHNPIVSSHELKYEVEEPPTHGSPQTAQYYCTEEYCRKRTDRLSILTDQAQHRVLLDCHESVSKEPLSFEPHQHNPDLPARNSITQNIAALCNKIVEY